MAFFRHPFLRRYFRTAILVAVGLLGLATTGWVAHEMRLAARDRLEQRFQREAQERADAVVSSYEATLTQFVALQRLFQSVGDVSWSVFEKFAEPINWFVGVRGLGWAPLVDEKSRDEFERVGKKLWGQDFAIREMDAAGRAVVSREHARYFPVLYHLPSDFRQQVIGLNLYAHADRRPLIDQAIEDGLPAASKMGPSVIDHMKTGKVVVFAVPVYRAGFSPLTREERRRNVRGVLFAAIDMATLFESIMALAPQNGLRVSLVDFADPSQVLLSGTAEEPAKPGSAAFAAIDAYTRTFELGGRFWTVRVEPGQTWLEANATGGEYFVPLVGVLLTLWLLFYLHRLLGRSALFETLVASHEGVLERQRVTEAWARKLSLVVEQSPASIVITDLNARIEYVNDKFVETTGYSREEAIGQDVRVINPGLGKEEEKSVYRELWANLRAGQNWQGELPNRRRDGSVYWERVMAAPIFDGDGVFRNFVGIKEDITELHSVMTLLRASESRFRGAMSVMAEGLLILSPEGLFLFANRAAEEILDCAESGVQGLAPRDLRVERLREDGSPCPVEDSPAMIALRDGVEVRSFVQGYRYTDGRVRWTLVNASPLLIGESPNAGVVMTLSDITERRRDEEQLKLAFEAIKHSGEGILVADAGRRIVSVNPAFETLTGFSPEDVIGQTPSMLASVQHDEAFFNDMQEQLDRTDHWQGEIWNRRKGGDVFPAWLGVSVVRDGEGRAKYYVYIFSDMSERQAAQQRIEFLAHHDPLTELPNRLLLRDRAEQALAQANRMQSRMALLFLDLDRFKTINDSLGHPVGDALLRAVVERLKGCVRESDTISRQGGDEFVILLNDVRDGEAVSRVADKIHQRMGEPFMIAEHSLQTSFSIGVALYPDDGIDFDSLLQKADTAMYHAKEAGRNSHRFFTEQMNLQVVEHLTLETQLRRALENKEFVLHYQPQMDLQEGRIIGVEALIRWNHPENGLVPPGKFIPVAEDSGLIVPIGAWVLGEACRQARIWQDAGLPPFVVAVNLSAIQFRRLDLVNNVINALVLSDLDSQWLELELTESILIQDAEATLDTVRRLKALGVKLSVDDFGTGYSSLAYLKRFAVDKLKIDQSFIRELLSDPDDAAIVRAIIQMAHSLKLKTIAEGVESEELANLLRMFRCDEAQGYWFARPMPAHELEAFVRSRLESAEAGDSLALPS